jgi:hypothetical protein
MHRGCGEEEGKEGMEGKGGRKGGKNEFYPPIGGWSGKRGMGEVVYNMKLYTRLC